MEAIGGYFELELQKGEHYHKDALMLNTARNCFEYILKARRYKKVYMPFYTCDVMFQPLAKLRIDYSYYHINDKFEIEELPVLNGGEAILYTNYFALKQDYVIQLASHYGSQLIVDNAQAFYAPRLEGLDTFYSARKFFGVPDGAYLYTDCILDECFQQDVSINRMSHLLGRIEYGAEVAYQDFRKADDSLDNLPIRYMSKLTDAILMSIDYTQVAKQRRKNYMYIMQSLARTNLLQFTPPDNCVPMAYPYVSNIFQLRQCMINNRVYIPRYWDGVGGLVDEGSVEHMLYLNLLSLPIDQRLDMQDIDKILNVISQE